MSSKGDPVLYVSDPPGMNRGLRRASLDALQRLEPKSVREWLIPKLSPDCQYELAYHANFRA